MLLSPIIIADCLGKSQIFLGARGDAPVRTLCLDNAKSSHCQMFKCINGTKSDDLFIRYWSSDIVAHRFSTENAGKNRDNTDCRETYLTHNSDVIRH